LARRQSPHQSAPYIVIVMAESTGDEPELCPSCPRTADPGRKTKVHPDRSPDALANVYRLSHILR